MKRERQMVTMSKSMFQICMTFALVFGMQIPALYVGIIQRWG